MLKTVCYFKQRDIKETKKTTNGRILFELTLFLYLTLSWGRSLSNRNQSIDLHCKSMDWSLYDRDLWHERVTSVNPKYLLSFVIFPIKSTKHFKDFFTKCYIFHLSLWIGSHFLENFLKKTPFFIGSTVRGELDFHPEDPQIYKGDKN